MFIVYLSYIYSIFIVCCGLGLVWGIVVCGFLLILGLLFLLLCVIVCFLVFFDIFIC